MKRLLSNMAARAVLRGNYGVARALRRAGGDVNAQDRDGNTVSHHLCNGSLWNSMRPSNSAEPRLNHGATWSLSGLQVVAQIGADFNRTNNRGWSPLHFAALRVLIDMYAKYSSTHRRVDILKFLLEHGANPNLRSNSGMTPLHCICDLTFEEEDQNAYPRRMPGDPRNLWLAQHGEIATIRDAAVLLVKRGANVNELDGRGQPPLQSALRHCRTSLINTYLYQDYCLVDALIQCGASLSSIRINGQTPLTYALSNADYPLCRRLIESGVDVNEVDDDGLHPVQALMSSGNMYNYGHPKCLRLLIEHGGRFDIRRHEQDALLLYFSCPGNDNGYHEGFPKENHHRSTRWHTVKAALARGYDATRRDKEGRTLLWYAANLGDPGIVELLVSAGASAREKYPDGTLPVHVVAINWNDAVGHQARIEATHTCYAIGTGDYEQVIELLSQHGADINECTDKGDTPLVLATKLAIGHRTRQDFLRMTWSKSPELTGVIEFLLRHGADANSTDNSGKTARMLIEEKPERERPRASNTALSFLERAESRE